MVDDLSAVRVLGVDDNAPWRRFVAAQLRERSVPLVGTAVDGFEAVQQAIALQPDIVIMDIWMPGMNGLAATREIGVLAPASRILIVSNENDSAIVQAAFDAGARGYMLKARAAVELLPAIEAIIRGDLFIGSGVTRGSRDDPHRDS